MKRILTKLVTLCSSTRYIYLSRAIKKHSHLPEIEEVYQLYMSDYVYKDGKFHTTPEFNTIKELEEYLKQNVEGYENNRKRK